MDRGGLAELLRAYGDPALADAVAAGVEEYPDGAVDLEPLRTIYRRRLRRNNLPEDLQLALERILAAIERPGTTLVEMLRVMTPSHDVLVLVDQGRGQVLGVLPATREWRGGPTGLKNQDHDL